MTVTINDQNVSVEGNLYQLDSLVNGYKEILSQAQQQLETLELDDQQLRRIENRTIENLRYGNIALAVIEKIYEQGPESHIIELFCNRLQDEMWGRLTQRGNNALRELIRQEIGGLVNERFDELRVMIDNRFERLQNDERRAAAMHEVDLTNGVRYLFQKAFGDQMKDAVAEQLAASAAATQATASPMSTDPFGHSATDHPDSPF